MSEDRNCLSFWFGRVEEGTGIPVPRTTIVRADGDLTPMLDGEKPECWERFLAELRAAVESHGTPCFLRTGHGSGKHEWDRNCYLASPDALGQHVYNLVEWSHLVDIGGLPHGLWAVRDLIPTRTLFRCRSYGGFPVTREFRLFVRDDEVEHTQPYWPADAVERGDPDINEWREVLEAAGTRDFEDNERLNYLARRACQAVGGGYWSIDLLADENGRWWLIDMAEGDRSFKYEPE